ncbi:hypothetical protein BC937DRAFT_89069 [Endogone sp. FLAS-F59071]|nr:hypothetical protein BC937DRAFT_89069 [Endogone sp. FLAS-F59071]|eukprot:RUS18176.1 hypothetical protein BC937DRAFT_89069 [Endogone sp. FLAS-F59071]
MVGALSYGCLVFTFGDAEMWMDTTSSWIQLVALYIALFGFGGIVKLPFTKTSLPNIAHWPFGIAILTFAAYHIYFAVHLGGIYLLLCLRASHPRLSSRRGHSMVARCELQYLSPALGSVPHRQRTHLALTPPRSASIRITGKSLYARILDQISQSRFGGRCRDRAGVLHAGSNCVWVR